MLYVLACVCAFNEGTSGGAYCVCVCVRAVDAWKARGRFRKACERAVARVWEGMRPVICGVSISGNG